MNRVIPLILTILLNKLTHWLRNATNDPILKNILLNKLLLRDTDVSQSGHIYL